MKVKLMHKTIRYTPTLPSRFATAAILACCALFVALPTNTSAQEPDAEDAKDLVPIKQSPEPLANDPAKNNRDLSPLNRSARPAKPAAPRPAASPKGLDFPKPATVRSLPRDAVRAPAAVRSLPRDAAGTLTIADSPESPSQQFDKEQRQLQNEVDRLKKRLQQLEEKLSERASRKDSIVRRRVAQPARPNPPSSSANRLPSASSRFFLPPESRVSAPRLPRAVTQSPQPDRTFPSAPFASNITTTSQISSRTNPFGAVTLHTDNGTSAINSHLVRQLDLIMKQHRELDALDKLNPDQQQQIERLSSQYPIVCEQIVAQRKLIELNVIGEKQKLERLKQARKTVTEAGLSGNATNEIDGAIAAVTVRQKSLAEQLKALSDETLKIGKNRTLKSKHQSTRDNALLDDSFDSGISRSGR